MKTIGDEVMFVVTEAVAAARIAVALAEAYGDDELLSDVRVGLASGPVLVRDGDYFGATVNLASRIVGVADPGTVLVSDAFHQRLGRAASAEFITRPLRPRELKDVGRVQLWSCRRRRSGGDDTPGADRSRSRRARRSRILRDLDDRPGARERTVGRSDGP